MHEGERLADAVLRSLRQKAGVSGLAPQQLHVFDDPARDDRGWVLSVAHLDVVPAHALDLNEARVRLAPVVEARGMVHGHDDILGFAVARLRSVYGTTPDPHVLLDEPFTMSGLRQLHEAVLGKRLLPGLVPACHAAEAGRDGHETGGRAGEACDAVPAGVTVLVQNPPGVVNRNRQHASRTPSRASS
ncbi:hypothetical protein Q9Q99_00240 [Curtobacterium flaccumfaciens]|nr:hypothetical protein Q9Q99_00240 [Curtobacterium flaccumfaciens]